MKTSEVLKKALAKIKKGWCQGALARSKSDRKVKVHSKSAVKFCSSGAILASTTDPNKQYLACFELRCIIGQYIPNWNDDPCLTKKEVIEAFKKAIKLAEEKEEKEQ